MDNSSIKTFTISNGLDGYLQVMEWWNKKDLTAKARVIGENTLDGWFEQIIRDELLGTTNNGG